MTDKQAIAAYEHACPDDPINDRDDRRDAIIAEVRAVILAKTMNDAAGIIEWWYNGQWDQTVRARGVARKIRNFAAKPKRPQEADHDTNNGKP